uniref:Uncharacterized protein n=1 Tax=Cacopsylla melanoneura TaxID=428564 RepID=A0A8D9AT96_9HEMI
MCCNLNTFFHHSLAMENESRTSTGQAETMFYFYFLCLHVLDLSQENVVPVLHTLSLSLNFNFDVYFSNYLSFKKLPVACSRVHRKHNCIMFCNRAKRLAFVFISVQIPSIFLCQ